MLNKKFILKFVCLLTSLFIYAESGTIGFLDQNDHITIFLFRIMETQADIEFK